MSLSKKNLDKLNTFIKKNNLINKNSNNKSKKSDYLSKSENPSKIFYSIINNTENINDTSEPNQLLQRSEENFHNIHSKNNLRKINLSIEDQLYDEFNYLLDE